MFRDFDRRIEHERSRWTVGKRAAFAAPALVTALLAAAGVTSLSLSPTNIASGGSSTGTVTVSGLATLGLTQSVSLTSSNTAIATVPPSVIIGAKTQNGTFTAHGVAGAAGCPVISARVGTTIPKSAMLFVHPPAATGLLRITVPTNGAVGGSSVTGQLTWMAVPPAGGVVVQLSSTSPKATVPATVTIPPGAVNEVGVAAVPFTITTSVVAPTTCAVITGTSGSAQARALLKILTISG